jgi:hypothetical protein
VKRRRCFPLGLLTALVLVFSAVPGVAASTDTRFDTAKVEEAGVSFEYPSSWTLMPRTRAALHRQLKVLRRDDPRLAALVEENARLDLQPSTLRARVLDMRGYLAGQGTGNIRVYVHRENPLPSTLDAYMTRFKLLEDALKVTVLNAATHRVDKKRTAYRVDMRQMVDGTTDSLRITWLTVPFRGGDVSVHVTLTGDAGAEALIDHVVDGVHLMEESRHSSQ